MNKNLVATQSIEINASAAAVWEVLTNPEKIAIYLYGTQTITDWEVGSSILFQGEYDGHQYQDKGNVLEKKLNQVLKYNYWSGFSGLEDDLANYSIVAYTIDQLEENKVKFTWTQQGFANEKGQIHTQQGLGALLEQIKALAEAA